MSQPHTGPARYRKPAFWWAVLPAGGALMFVLAAMAGGWKVAADRGDLPAAFWVAASACGLWLAFWLAQARRAFGLAVALGAAAAGWSVGRTEPPVPTMAPYYQQGQGPAAQGYAPPGYPASGWTPAPSYQPPHQSGPAPSYGGSYGY